MTNNRRLQDLYRKYNRKWFGNKLPKDLPVIFAHCETKTQLGFTSCWEANKTFEAEYIVISSELIRPLSGGLIEMTLLHEMAHVAVPHDGKHGKPWKREMRRLMRIGAFDDLL